MFERKLRFGVSATKSQGCPTELRTGNEPGDFLLFEIWGVIQTKEI